MTNPFIEGLETRACLTSESIRQLQDASSKVAHFGARRHIVKQHDSPVASFALLSGWACCYTLNENGSRQIVRLMMPGDFCELHPDVSFEMDYAIEAITAVRLTFLPLLGLGHKLAERPDVQQALYRLRVRDDAIARAWLSRLSGGDSLVSMSHLICELYVRAGGSMAGGGEVRLPLTQPVLADATNMTSVHANRILKRMREQAGVTLRLGILSINDFKSLASLADFDATYLSTKKGQVPPDC